MIIYRIETHDGAGLFTAGYIESSMSTPYRPMPYDDALTDVYVIMNYDYRFGWHDWAHVMQWLHVDDDMTHELFVDHRDVFRLRVYRVPSDYVTFGRSQCVFPLSESRLVADLPVEHARLPFPPAVPSCSA